MSGLIRQNSEIKITAGREATGVRVMLLHHCLQTCFFILEKPVQGAVRFRNVLSYTTENNGFYRFLTVF